METSIPEAELCSFYVSHLIPWCLTAFHAHTNAHEVTTRKQHDLALKKITRPASEPLEKHTMRGPHTHTNKQTLNSWSCHPASTRTTAEASWRRELCHSASAGQSSELRLSIQQQLTSSATFNIHFDYIFKQLQKCTKKQKALLKCESWMKRKATFLNHWVTTHLWIIVWDHYEIFS